MKLSDLKPGESGVVTGLCGEARLSARLMEMGVIPGRLIEVIRKAPFGDPVEYRVCGVRISMRSADAACVEMTEAPVAIPA
jgi:Fe2+ transport system protein FeoA